VKVKVLVADDDQRYRKFIKWILKMERDVEVVAEAADGEDAVQLSQRLKPDLVLMDIDLPRLDGLLATRHLKAGPGSPRVIMLSSIDGRTYREAAAKYGADGFLPKNASISQILLALRGGVAA
jgi:DNA-binding NarL/FixJ family response regulator